jgi:hypothetical protein
MTSKSALFVSIAVRIRKDLQRQAVLRNYENVDALCGALADAVTAVDEGDMPKFRDELMSEMALCSEALEELGRSMVKNALGEARQCALN